MKKRYVITSAQACAKPNRDFLRSLEKYSVEKDAEILIIPLKGKKVDEIDLDDTLSKYSLIDCDYRLGSHLQVSDWAINPTQIIPVTGLGRFAQTEMTTIFGSPKQFMKAIPTSNNRIPKVLMTTGSVTLPNYNEKFRTGQIALKDHRYGAIVVEIDDDDKYQFRHLTSLVNGKFYDLGRLYQPRGKSKVVRPEALVLGDWHTGETNDRVRSETFEMIKEYRPKRIILHDFWNNASISHHEEGKLVEKVISYNENRLDLGDELKACYEELQAIKSVCPRDSEIIIVKSNHDEGLERYLNEARFVKEPQNALIASKLLTAALEGKDPLKEGISLYGPLPKKVVFLSRDDDYKVRGIQLGSHGDLGANGARGSVRSNEFANGRSVSGHSHTPEMFRDVYKVGTSTDIKLRYNKGFSSWMNTHCLVYENGKCQLVNIIDGKHKL